MDGIQVLFIFLLLLVVSGLVFWIYDAWYKARINKALQEDRPAGPTPEPRRVGKVILFLLAAACVLGFLLWANSLQTRIAELERSIRSDMYSLSNRIDQNYQSLIDELRAESAMFAAYEYEITEVDPTGRTVCVRVTAAPKESSADAAVLLRFGDRELELQRGANGIWTGEAQIALGESLKLTEAALSVVEDGKERTQKVDFYLQGALWSYFPKMVPNADYVERSWKDGKLDLKAELSFTIGQTEQMTSLAAVVRAEGETLLEQDLYGMIRGASGDFFSEPVTVEGQFDLPADREMTLLLRFTDKLGFLHESAVCTFWASEEEPLIGLWEESVYDTDGTLLLTTP